MRGDGQAGRLLPLSLLAASALTSDDGMQAVRVRYGAKNHATVNTHLRGAIEPGGITINITAINAT